LFTPWATPCVVPEKFDPFSEQIDELNFQGRHPDEEHEVEVNRIHATLHPDCFARLAAATGLPAPGDRLELPYFFLAEDSDDHNHNSRVPPNLSEDEMRLINDLLAQEAGRRKAAASGFFRVLVDGLEVAQIEPARRPTEHFMVQDSAELIEVYGSDESGPLLMATHLLDLNDGENRNFKITLEGGQSISFALDPVRTEESATRVAVSVAETAALKKVLAAAGRLGSFLGFSTGGATHASGWWKPIAALATIALLIAGGWLLWRNQTRPQQVVSVGPTPPAISPTPLPVNNPAPETARNEKPETGSKPTPVTTPKSAIPERDETFVARTIVPANETGDPNEAETRGGLNPELKSKALGSVRRVHLQIAESSGRTFSSELEQVFRQGSNLQLSSADTADAALKISVRAAGANDPRVIVTVIAVGADGKPIWPATRRNSKLQYTGHPRYIAERLLTDLKRDIEKARR